MISSVRRHCNFSVSPVRVCMCVENLCLQSAKIWHLPFSHTVFLFFYLKSCVCVFVDDTFSSAFRVLFCECCGSFTAVCHFNPIPHVAFSIVPNVRCQLGYLFFLSFCCCKSKEHTSPVACHLSCVHSRARTHTHIIFHHLEPELCVKCPPAYATKHSDISNKGTQK